jgi:hypothetical protein
LPPNEKRLFEEDGAAGGGDGGKDSSEAAFPSGLLHLSVAVVCAPGAGLYTGLSHLDSNYGRPVKHPQSIAGESRDFIVNASQSSRIEYSCSR